MTANGVAHLADRRENVNAALMHLIEELTLQVHEMRTEAKLQEAKRQDDRAALVARLMEEWFPDGDPSSHRKYHENLIKAQEERIALYKKLRDELIKWGLIGFCGWFVLFAGHAFWLEILHQVKK